MMGSLGGCAEKIGKGRWTGGHEFDKELAHIRDPKQDVQVSFLS
jgi:hypothetical protein